MTFQLNQGSRKFAHLLKIHTTQENCFYLSFQILKPQFGRITGQPFEQAYLFQNILNFLCLFVCKNHTCLWYQYVLFQYWNDRGNYLAKGRNHKTELINNYIQVTTYHKKRYIHLLLNLTRFEMEACMTYYDSNVLSKLCLSSLESMIDEKC